MGTFKAVRIDKAEKGTTVALTQFDEAELMEGDVTVHQFGFVELRERAVVPFSASANPDRLERCHGRLLKLSFQGMFRGSASCATAGFDGLVPRSAG